jgi:hypothetical protein
VTIVARNKKKRKLKNSKLRKMLGTRSVKTDKRSEPRSENRTRKNITRKKWNRR